MATSVVVVGAGIAGLAAAHALSRRAPGCRITVLEGSPAVGGKLRTSELAGIAVDEGAESFLLRVPEGAALTDAVGLGPDLVSPAVGAAAVWTRGRLRPLPTGTLLGIPGDLRALASSGAVSPRGTARAALDLALPGPVVTRDLSVGELVGRRLGREVVDRLVDPLLGGVYAGRADDLSLDMTVPQLTTAARRERSLIRAVRSVATSGTSSGPVFGGLRGGLGRLAEAVLRDSGAELRTRCAVRELHRTPTGWRLVTGPVPSPEVIEADAVVVAVPATPAARLLATSAPVAAAELREVDYASVAIVSLAWPAEAWPDAPALSGFLVPAVDSRAVKAATFSSQKWAHLRGEMVVVRCSLGRYGEPHDLQRTDDELVASALADLRDATGLAAAPIDSRVTRWGGGLPQYRPGHRDRVGRIRRDVAAHPGLAVCGAAYDGVGIPACIRSAQAAVDVLLPQLGGRGTIEP